MARQPATPVADDPSSERVTLTRGEIEQMVAAGIARHAADSQPVRRRVEDDRSRFPTLEEAQAQSEARIADGIPPHGIETKDGWYAHPLVGASAEQVEQHLLRRAKKAAGKKLLDGQD